MMRVTEHSATVLGMGFDSNVHVVSDKGKVLVVDAGTGRNHERLVRSLAGLGAERGSVVAIVLTHAHPDHAGGAAALAKALDAPVLCHAAEAGPVRDGSVQDLFGMLAHAPEPVEVAEVREGKAILVGGLRLAVLDTPGHSPGSISLWEEHERLLVSGDTVFPGGSFGRTDLGGGSIKRLISSLERLARLDAEALLPGHMPPIGHGAGEQVAASLRNARGMM